MSFRASLILSVTVYFFVLSAHTAEAVDHTQKRSCGARPVPPQIMKRCIRPNGKLAEEFYDIEAALIEQSICRISMDECRQLKETRLTGDIYQEVTIAMAASGELRGIYVNDSGQLQSRETGQVYDSAEDAIKGAVIGAALTKPKDLIEDVFAGTGSYFAEGYIEREVADTANKEFQAQGKTAFGYRQSLRSIKQRVDRRVRARIASNKLLNFSKTALTTLGIGSGAGQLAGLAVAFGWGWLSSIKMSGDSYKYYDNCDDATAANLSGVIYGQGRPFMKMVQKVNSDGDIRRDDRGNIMPCEPAPYFNEYTRSLFITGDEYVDADAKAQFLRTQPCLCEHVVGLHDTLFAESYKQKITVKKCAADRMQIKLEGRTRMVNTLGSELAISGDFSRRDDGRATSWRRLGDKERRKEFVRRPSISKVGFFSRPLMLRKKSGPTGRAPLRRPDPVWVSVQERTYTLKREDPSHWVGSVKRSVRINGERDSYSCYSASCSQPIRDFDQQIACLNKRCPGRYVKHREDLIVKDEDRGYDLDKREKAALDNILLVHNLQSRLYDAANCCAQLNSQDYKPYYNRMCPKFGLPRQRLPQRRLRPGTISK